MSETLFDKLKRKIQHFTWAKLSLKVGLKILNLSDACHDYRICGCSLVKYVPSIYRNDKEGIGMTGTESTHYAVLDRIFSHVELHASDSFMDVGCEKGRVLAYLVSKKTPCVLNGVEINPVSAATALEWAARYKNVHITEGDAFLVDYDEYTILFLGRPFLPKTFVQFIEKLEGDLTHSITFIYWWDQESGYLLKERKGWTCEYREELLKVHGLQMYPVPQGFSVWKYEPVNKGEV